MYKSFLRQRQWQWHYRTRWQLAAHPHQFAAEEQQKLDEKAVENQAEDEVESHDEANQVQIVKKCQTRKCSKLYIRFRLQKSRVSMTMESRRGPRSKMETWVALREQKSQRGRQPNLATKFRRSVKGLIPRNTIRRNEQEVTNNTKHAQRATNEKSIVPEVTKTKTSKINHEVVNVTRSKSSESQPRSSTEDKS